MARVEELEVRLRPLDDLRRVGVHVHREEGHRLDGVELAEDRGHEGEVVRPVSRARRQLLQDPQHLVALLVLQLHDVVVQLDRGERLHEEARAGARGAVDDPGQLALVLGLQQQT